MALVLAGLLAGAAGIMLTAMISRGNAPAILGANQFCQRSIIPAYFSPGTGWPEASDSRPAPGVMILDITGSGAGTSPDRRYRIAAEQAQAAGIKVVGYSATNYTRRPAAEIENDVKNYRAWYGVTDIFLDEVSSSGSQIGYYRDLASYVHRVNPGSTVILNPGTYPDEQYMSVGDVVMVYENTYSHFVRLQPPDWAQDYPASKFAYVIYGTPRSFLANAISLAQRRHAGYIYVTDRTGRNPYSSLPSYWPSEDALIAARCAQ